MLVCSRGQCVFHVDGIRTSTCGRMWTKGGQKSDFCGRHKWMAPIGGGLLDASDCVCIDTIRLAVYVKDYLLESIVFKQCALINNKLIFDCVGNLSR